MKVAFTHAFCWPEVRRGGERYLNGLAGAMARRGHQVTIFAGASRSNKALEDGVQIVRMRRRSSSRSWVTERRFGRRVSLPLATGAFDVVHSLGVRDAVASLRAARLHARRRTVHTCLGVPLRDWWDRRPDRSAHEDVVAHIDVYGCLSSFARERLRQEYGRRGALTPGGVSLTQFAPVAPRTPLPTLLYSGALDVGRKGLAELFEAVALLAKSEPRVRLWLSGPGDPSRFLSAAPSAAQERTEVLPLGRLEDQPTRYASAWATVLPSRNEAFGLVLVESLACGTPIVANSEGSLPELVEPGCGVTASAADPHALADALKAALELASEPSTVQRSRESARRHDWDEGVAPAVESLYDAATRDGI